MSSPAKAAPASEIDVWALYGHLQQLHSELHPAQPQRSASFADALRHLKSRDASAAREVQELVKGASRQLKRAIGRLEEILEAPLPPGSESEEEFDPFEDMEAGEVRHSPEYSAPENDTATNGSATNGSATNGTIKNDSAANSVAEPPPPLSPTRQAAARRTVGRTMRSELQFEKDRFSKAAKGQELPPELPLSTGNWAAAFRLEFISHMVSPALERLLSRFRSRRVVAAPVSISLARWHHSNCYAV